MVSGSVRAPMKFRSNYGPGAQGIDILGFGRIPADLNMRAPCSLEVVWRKVRQNLDWSNSYLKLRVQMIY